MILLGLCAPLTGRTVDQYASDATKAMKASKWQEAHTLLSTATSKFDGRALAIFGPRFGWFWYQKGYCELKLRQFDEAAASFKICYEKYKNRAPKEGQRPSVNLFNKKALLMWGHAAKGSEEWKQSIKMYKKFLQERDKNRDTYNIGVLHINMAINHYKLGQLDKGHEFMEKALENKVKWETPNTSIMSVFNVLVEKSIELEKEKDLLGFISRNRSHVKLEPFESHQFTPLLMKLAQDAKDAEMLKTTFELYALIPSTVSIIDDVKARQFLVGDYERTIRDGSMILKKADLDADLVTLEEVNANGQVNEIYAYLNTAVLHEEEENVRGAFAVYEQLELYFPNAAIVSVDKDGKREVRKMREDNLFNLVRTSAVIGEVLITEKYGSLFLRDFPDSKYVDEVRRMMLTSLFFNSEYEKCVEVAEIMMPKLSKPSKQHDICLFVLGGSKHYLGAFYEAQPMLDEYIKTYGGESADKTRLQAATYFQAANRSRLQEFKEAGRLLDKFLKKYPEPRSNIYYPFALFDRANCHYSEEEPEPALKLVTRVEEEFPGVSVMESNFALKGNILQTLKRPAEAEEYYIKALDLAERKKNDLVAGECLFYLTALLGEEPAKGKKNPKLKESVKYYNKFWEEYPESPFKGKVAVAGIPGMAEIGKRKEALERLQVVIADISNEPNTPDLEEVIGSYTEAYLVENSAEELKEHYYNFPGIDSRDKTTRALLRIAIISVFEDELKKAEKEKDQQKIARANADIKTLFGELQTDFKPEEMTPFILVKVGRFINKTRSPMQAVPYFKKALEDKKALEYRLPAMNGLAKSYALGGSSDQKREAIGLLKKVGEESESSSEKAEALFTAAEIHFNLGEYDAVVTKTREYINNRRFRKKNVDCRYLLAQAHDKNGKVEDAIVSYQNFLLPSLAGSIKFSAPSVHRWMELLWSRNGKNSAGVSDRQLAYDSGKKYLRDTSRAITNAKVTEEEHELYEKVTQLVKEFGAHSDTTDEKKDK